MAEPVRVTSALLDVLEVLLQDGGRAELHGWAIMKAIKRSGPTVYGVLDRLEDAGWITGRWEDQHPEPNKPRRRFYQLTPNGINTARDLLTARRPNALHQPLRRPAPGLAFGRPHSLQPGGAR